MKNNGNLIDVLEYSNDDVINRFVEKYNIDEQEALKIFEETKKWLWICVEGNKLTDKFNFIIDDSLLIIDEMWHNFILFTRDYHQFCNSFFGHYIHHQPTTKNEKLEWEKDVVGNLALYKLRLKIQYNHIYDLLGEETLKLWYTDFADKYTKEYVNSVTK